MYRFAHMADCHIGGWNDPKMRELSHSAFLEAVDICIREKVSFVLVAGDLFNTALPGIDSLKVAVDGLKKLSNNGINVYVIPGSHDFSPSGKTILDVLERAELLINVNGLEAGRLRFAKDDKTGAIISGIIGMRGSLERSIYATIGDDARAGGDDGTFKIFMFHSTLKELVPGATDMMDPITLSDLPKGFNYYAGGHVHIIGAKRFEELGGIASYPGPAFPNSFSELEELKGGGFYIVDVNSPNGVDSNNTLDIDTDKGTDSDTDISRYQISLRYIRLAPKKVLTIEVDCDGKTPEAINSELQDLAKSEEVEGAIVTIRMFGELSSGKTTEIDFKSFMRLLYDAGAYFILKNASKLRSKETREIEVKEASIDKIEEAVLEASPEDFVVEGWSKEKQKEVARFLMMALDKEKEEGETATDFEKRVKDDALKFL